MSPPRKKLPKGDVFVMLKRDLLESAAWRSLGINARRLVDFLMLEHVSHGGAQNGKLLAPYRQLMKRGISAGLILAAIAEAEASGVVDVERGGLRAATVFALGWLPRHDGTPPADRWRKFTPPPRKRRTAPTPTGRKTQKSASESGSRAASESGSRGSESASESGSR